MTKGSVVVFGSSQAPGDSAHYRLGRDLGATLARRGAIVRCGGYGGIMEAVAAGAKSEGGKVVGCTLSWFKETRVPNTHLDEVHDAPDLESRIRCLLTGARGAIVLPGGVGTMNELFWVWALLLLDRDDGPESLVLLGDHWKELLDLLTKRFEFGPPVRALVRIASSVEEAAGIAWERAA